MPQNETQKAIKSAIKQGDRAQVRELLSKHRDELNYNNYGLGTWMHIAATMGTVEILDVLLDLGCDINAETINSSRDAPLFCAIAEDNPPMVEALLERGADPNHGRPVITAITGMKRHSLAMVKLLEKHGADLHHVFPFADGSNINAFSMAIDWQKEDVVDYLRSRGCVMPDAPFRAADDAPVKAVLVPDLDDEIVAHFTKQYGPVHPQALIEIVPTEPPIAVHVIPAAEERDHITLFTTGMSARPMNVPAGQEAFRFAEIFVQLPADWKYRALSDAKYGWPLHWLRRLAQHPHHSGTWLGGAVALFGNEEPPEPLAPNTNLTTLMLMADQQFAAQDGTNIQLYRMMPLYPEESQLELERGLPELMHALDRHSIPFIVDVNRRNVAL